MILPDKSKGARIGIIGGTGVRDPKLIKDAEEVKVHTPYGQTSDLITIGTYIGRRVAFLPRHGNDHTVAPHKINYRANIWALKKLGVEYLISPTAVGSLREDMRAGDFVITTQFIDRTKERPCTFFDEGQVAHVSTADPMCPVLRSLLIDSCKNLGIPHHEKGTYVCIEGPRFSTRAESKMFRLWGADVVGMTLFPEAPLAREAQMCFANISMVSDYDSWNEEKEAVSNAQVIEIMKENSKKLRKLLQDVLPKIPKGTRDSCECSNALENALM